MKEPWIQLGINIVGILAITAWSAVWMGLIFGVLRLANLLRIDDETEEAGSDAIKHGEPAYPEMYEWFRSVRQPSINSLSTKES